MKDELLLRKVLKDKQYKITDARLLIFRLLRENGPQSITELTAASIHTIDRVSVYRVINLYEKLGITRCINIGWKYKLELSDIFLDHHHHISCLSCGRVVAIEEDKKIEQRIKKLGETSGFFMTSHQLELQGYCNKCQRNQNAQKNIGGEWYIRFGQ